LQQFVSGIHLWSRTTVRRILKKKRTEENSKCYSLQILEINPGLKHEAKLAIFAEAEKRMKEHTLLVDTLELESLAKRKKRMSKDRRGKQTYRDRYENVMKQDLKNIYNMTTQVTWREAKACSTTDGKELTKYELLEDELEYRLEDGKYLEYRLEDGKDHFGTYEYDKGHCDLQICAVEDPKPPTKPKPPTNSCDGSCKSGWTQWSDWGACDKECGEERKKKRTRKCVCNCDTTIEKEDCAPKKAGTPMDPDRKITNEDFEACTLCPPDLRSKWGEWGEWTSDGGYKCSDEEGAKTTYTRKRECKLGISGRKCFSIKSGKGEGSEEETSCDGRTP